MTTTLQNPTSLVKELLEPNALAAYLNRGGLHVEEATATYTRYKPGSGAVIAMELTLGDTTHLAYLRRALDPKRAAQVVAKAATMKPRPTDLGRSVRLLDRNTVLFLFPTDAKLRRLRWVASGNKIRHLVTDTFDDGPYCGEQSSISILRYKPERRLVGKAHLVTKHDHAHRSFVYRLTVDSDAEKLADINQAARDAGIATPRPLATLQHGRLHLEEALDAQPLVDSIRDNPIDPEALVQILEQISSVSCGSLDVTTPADDLTSAMSALNSTQTYQPQLTAKITALAAALTKGCPSPGGPLVTSHGDLHLHQFMVDADTAYLVDWERATLGHPARDAGRLLAHPCALQLRRPELPTGSLVSLVSQVIDLFRQRQPITEAHLGFYLAVAFVDQALLVSRHLEPNNHHRAATLLDLAANALTQGTAALRSASPTDRNRS